MDQDLDLDRERPQETPGGPRRFQEAPGERPQETPGGPRRPQEIPGGPRRPQEAPGGQDLGYLRDASGTRPDVSLRWPRLGPKLATKSLKFHEA